MTFCGKHKNQHNKKRSVVTVFRTYTFVPLHNCPIGGSDRTGTDHFRYPVKFIVEFLMDLLHLQPKGVPYIVELCFHAERVKHYDVERLA